MKYKARLKRAVEEVLFQEIAFSIEVDLQLIANEFNVNVQDLANQFI